MAKPTRIHSLVSQSGRTFKTLCGVEIKLKGRDRLPDFGTAYWSLVTCLACKRKRREYHERR